MQLKYVPASVDTRTGLLTTNLTTQRTIQENFHQTGQLKSCFKSPHYLTLNVTDSLHIPKKGWTMIKQGIEKGEQFTPAWSACFVRTKPYF